MTINIEDHKTCKLHYTCHCRDGFCLDICKDVEVYYGDEIAPKGKASFDCIILKNKYILIDFKNVKSAKDKNFTKEFENLKNKYLDTKETFNINENNIDDVIIVFGGVLADYDNKNIWEKYDRIVRNVIYKFNPLKLKDRTFKVLYKLCKSDYEDRSFENYLIKIGVI